ncbi:hypothetical protein BDR26DRAFT_849955 [Obelidium mucronatum]|nr:hypothetical protein BDR26DRAFT_849955 [Obelidium mucronatum]
MTTFGPQRKYVPDVDEVVKSTPLFMQSLDDAADNDTLSAIQSLIFDGTPEEMALNSKELGNEAFQLGKKHYKDALDHYSKGLAAKCGDANLNSVLYCNRAAVNLELGNFRKVLNDCGEAIKLNPANIKAFYRSTKALLSLDRIVEARDSCKLGLQARGVTTKPDPEDITRLTQKAFLSTHRPILDPETNTLSYPVMFLYPEHTLSDLISAFHEQDSFIDHIHEMFSPENRPPWDTAGIYIPEKIEVYF